MSSEQDNLLLNLIIQALDKLDQKIDKISEKNDSIDVVMTKNTASLDEHIRRTNLIEQKIEDDVQPALDFYNGLLFVGKILGILALLATIVGGLVGLVELVK